MELSLELGVSWHAHENEVRRLSFDRDGRRLVSIGEDKKIRVWDTATMQVLCSIFDFNAGDVALSADGDFVISSGYGETKIWRMSTQELLLDSRDSSTFPKSTSEKETLAALRSCGPNSSRMLPKLFPRLSGDLFVGNGRNVYCVEKDEESLSKGERKLVAFWNIPCNKLQLSASQGIFAARVKKRLVLGRLLT